ncbi:MAG TPA: DUF2851 family protein [Chloroflexota bacterium]|nr:DUF2851 family protein [Chloroflexota bacterium]
MRQEIPAEQRLAGQWADSPPGQQIVTSDGTVLRVRYPGRLNPESGPDFLGAVLETDSGEVRGAVELHRRTSDWERHGHGADPRYGDVVLHIVGRDDGAVSLLPGGGQLPLAELSEDGGVAWDGEPRFPCAVQMRGDRRSALRVLSSAGEARFQAMVTRLRHDLATVRPDPQGQEQVVYAEIASGLGYSRNEHAMRELAGILPLCKARALSRQSNPVVRLESAYLGSAGLLPSARHLPAGRRHDPYVQALEAMWCSQRDDRAMRAFQWDFTHVRPENAPVRRIVGLAHLAHSWPVGGLLPVVREALQRESKEPAHRRLAPLVSVGCPSGYWERHWDFGVRAKGEAEALIDGASGRGIAALIGPSRAADIVVNTLLPVLIALGQLEDDTTLVERAWECYRAHPLLSENWITRLVRQRSGLQHLRENTSGDSAIMSAFARARIQQGLIAVYEQTCHALDCARCLLADVKNGTDPPLPLGATADGG